MKKYLLSLALNVGLFTAAAAQGDSVVFYLHKFEQNIGRETYYRRVSDSGVSYDVHFRFVDRGTAVPLEARLMVDRKSVV